MNLENAPPLVKFGRWLFQHRNWASLLLLPILFRVGDLEWSALTWYVGIVLILMGGAMRLWSISFLGRSARTRGDKAKQLITSGSFALCRNPIYLANIMVACGFVVLCKAIWYVPLYMVLSFAFYSFIVRYEEYLLLCKYPDQYSSYMEKTPRWLPDIKREVFAKPVYGISEIIYREKSFFVIVTAGFLLVIVKEIGFDLLT